MHANSRSFFWLYFSALAILAIAGLLALIPLQPEIYWDVSPFRQLHDTTITALGPAGTAWLNALAVAVSAIGLWAHYRCEKRISPWPCLAALVGILTTGLHMDGLQTNLFLGSSCIAAVTLALAVFHLAQHPPIRRFLLAGLIALLLPWLIQSLTYLWIDHPQTVRYFLSNEVQFVSQQGWEWNSPMHLVYKRRLLNPQITTTFGLSNVFGSLSAALTLLLAGFFLSACRSSSPSSSNSPANPQPSKTTTLFITGILTLAGVTLVLLSRSRGTILATVLVLPVLLLWHYRTRPAATSLPSQSTGLRWLPWIAFSCLIFVFACVLIRSCIGLPPSDPSIPSSFLQNERSLLFRWFYWQAAADIFLHQSWSDLFWGTGPAAYKQLHALWKPPYCSEDVTSSHNWLIDYLLILGAGGLAWSVLLLTWLWQSAKALILQHSSPATVTDSLSSPSPATSPWTLSRTDTWRFIILSLLIFIPQYVIFQPLMSYDKTLLWILGLTSYLLTCVLLNQCLKNREHQTLLGLFAASLVLLTHNQIDMTFFTPGALTLAWLILSLTAGTAAAFLSSHRSSSSSPLTIADRKIAAAAVTGSILLTLWLGLSAVYITSQQSTLRQSQSLIRAGDLPAAAQLLEKNLFIGPPNTTLCLALVETRLALIETTLATAAAPASTPTSASATTSVQTQIDTLLSTLQAFRQRTHDQLVLPLRLQAQILERSAILLNQPDRLSLATQLWAQIVAREPGNLAARQSYARLLLQTQQPAQAARQYQSILTISDQLYLDPPAQLPPAKYHEIQRWLATYDNKTLPSP